MLPNTDTAERSCPTAHTGTAPPENDLTMTGTPARAGLTAPGTGRRAPGTACGQPTWSELDHRFDPEPSAGRDVVTLGMRHWDTPDPPWSPDPPQSSCARVVGVRGGWSGCEAGGRGARRVVGGAERSTRAAEVIAEVELRGALSGGVAEAKRSKTLATPRPRPGASGTKKTDVMN
jgi:hypothetical protein